jgi:hypothetical protein
MNLEVSEQSEPGITKERDIATHILTTSSVMLGLCLTVISVMHSQKTADTLETLVDDIIAVDALIFLTACYLSYAALRVRHQQRIHRIECMADVVFLLGMSGMGLACVLFVWTIL